LALIEMLARRSRDTRQLVWRGPWR